MLPDGNFLSGRERTAELASTEQTTRQEQTYEHADPEHKVAYSFERKGDDLLVWSEMGPGALLPKHKHPIQREIWWVEDG